MTQVRVGDSKPEPGLLITNPVLLVPHPVGINKGSLKMPETRLSDHVASSSIASHR